MKIKNSIDDFFEITKRSSNVWNELLAGCSTFLALSYIVVVNPTILANGGADWQSTFVATAVISGLATIALGLLARLPFALAPGMEMNAYIAFSVVGVLGFSWPQAMGIVFWSGIAFFLISASSVRARIIDAIPDTMKCSLAFSVGLFIAMIAMKLSGVLAFEGMRITGFGSVFTPEATALCAGLAIIVMFQWLQLPFGVVVSVAIVSIGLWMSGHGHQIHATTPIQPFRGLALPDFSVVTDPRAWGSILLLLLIDFYGSAAKLVGIGHSAGLSVKADDSGMQNALLTDSGATIAGSLVGTSNITVYVESAVGIAAGGKTGLTAVTCGLLLLTCLIFSDVVSALPVAATTGALIFVATTLIPKTEILQKMGRFEWVMFAIMQLTILTTASLDKCVFLGASAYLARDLVLRRRINPYLAASVLLLAAGYMVEFFSS